MASSALFPKPGRGPPNITLLNKKMGVAKNSWKPVSRSVLPVPFSVAAGESRFDTTPSKNIYCVDVHHSGFD